MHRRGDCALRVCWNRSTEWTAGQQLMAIDTPADIQLLPVGCQRRIAVRTGITKQKAVNRANSPIGQSPVPVEVSRLIQANRAVAQAVARPRPMVDTDRIDPPAHTTSSQCLSWSAHTHQRHFSDSGQLTVRCLRKSQQKRLGWVGIYVSVPYVRTRKIQRDKTLRA